MEVTEWIVGQQILLGLGVGECLKLGATASASVKSIGGVAAGAEALAGEGILIGMNESLFPLSLH